MGIMETRLTADLDIAEAQSHLNLANVALCRAEVHMGATGMQIDELEAMEGEIMAMAYRLNECHDLIKACAGGADGV